MVDSKQALRDMFSPRGERGAAREQSMNEPTASPPALLHPPVVWTLALLAGVSLQRWRPMHFVTDTAQAKWIGGAIFVVGLALAFWAIRTLQRAGTHVQLHKPTLAIVDGGPYRFSRNPIYVALSIMLAAFAFALDNGWMLLAVIGFWLVVDYFVVMREEAYLEGKFGKAYLDYKARVRRWL
jgi:protein-S-isoprenylcysteine O-methyltransferase Ste14